MSACVCVRKWDDVRLGYTHASIVLSVYSYCFDLLASKLMSDDVTICLPSILMVLIDIFIVIMTRTNNITESTAATNKKIPCVVNVCYAYANSGRVLKSVSVLCWKVERGGGGKKTTPSSE